MFNGIATNMAWLFFVPGFWRWPSYLMLRVIIWWLWGFAKLTYSLNMFVSWKEH